MCRNLLPHPRILELLTAITVRGHRARSITTRQPRNSRQPCMKQRSPAGCPTTLAIHGHPPPSGYRGAATASHRSQTPQQRCARVRTCAHPPCLLAWHPYALCIRLHALQPPILEHARAGRCVEGSCDSMHFFCTESTDGPNEDVSRDHLVHAASLPTFVRYIPEIADSIRLAIPVYTLACAAHRKRSVRGF